MFCVDPTATMFEWREETASSQTDLTFQKTYKKQKDKETSEKIRLTHDF